MQYDIPQVKDSCQDNRELNMYYLQLRHFRETRFAWISRKFWTK